jgi:ribosomal protein S18 acetylase RimI-like enzyme
MGISHGLFDHKSASRCAQIIQRNTDKSLLQDLEPTAEKFLHLLQQVGSDYGWDKRKEYQPDNMAAIDRMVRDPGTRLFVFDIAGKRAGFCLVTEIKPEQGQHAQGMSKTDALNQYKMQQSLPNNSKAVEIHKFGLFDEFTGKGHGHYFLAKILKELFMNGGYDIVYLDTRDTNHAGVQSFYAANGIYPFLTEILENDLVEQAPTYPEPQNKIETSTTLINGDHQDDPPPTKDAEPH